MPSARSTTWLNRFVWLLCVATLFLICSGGMVTSKGVGLAVPDWPTTFGYNMFLFPVSKWIGGIFFEHTHRLIASIVGFMTIILAVWMWLAEDRRWVRNLGYLALFLVVLQGILGGLRVTMLKDEIGIFHACLAQAFLGLLVVIALVTTKFWQSLSDVDVSEPGGAGQLLPRMRVESSEEAERRSWATQPIASNWLPLGAKRVDLEKFGGIKSLALFATVAIYLQLALGATMRHQHRDLAILDFPTAYRQWIPDTNAHALTNINAWRDARALSDVTAFQIWLQMAHRFLAGIIAISIIALCLRIWKNSREIPALRRLSILWVVLVFCQITLGAWTIWSNKAADIATAHVAMGALMLSFGVSICAIILRLQSAWHGLPAREHLIDMGKMPMPRA